MRNITVSVDDDTYRSARIRAAELDTSVSAMVRGFLERLVEGQTGRHGAETERERRQRLLNAVFEDIRETRGSFRAADSLARDALYERDAVR